MILICSNCGKKNNVPDAQRHDGTYFCGNCQQPLTIAIGATFRKSIQPNRGHSKVFLLTGYLLAAVLVVIGFCWVMSKQGLSLPIQKGATSTLAAPQPNKTVVADQVTPAFHSHDKGGGAGSSLPNGTELVRLGSNGLGSLTIDNGTNTDAIVKLVGKPDGLDQMYASNLKHPSELNLDRKTYYEVYVDRSHKSVIEHIGQGAYRILFCLGDGWQEKTQEFANVQSYSEFEEPLLFDQPVEEVTGGQETHFHRYSITLHSVIEGTAKTNGITASEFNIR